METTIIFEEIKEINIKVQYELESLFQVFKTKFKDYKPIIDELDLIDDDDIITHDLELNVKHDTEKSLDVFHYDPQWNENEQSYNQIKREILGDDNNDDDDCSSDDDEYEDDDNNNNDNEDEYEDDEDETNNSDNDNNNDDIEDAYDINDLANTNVMNLRRNIYLTFVSAEEMAQKILSRFTGKEKHVSDMIIQACAQERSYRKQFGLLAEKLCKVPMAKGKYEDCFDELFPRQYEDMHSYDTNKIRNIDKFFGHLLYTNALDWTIFKFIRLNERDTNPSKRIFIKVLFQELAWRFG